MEIFLNFVLRLFLIETSETTQNISVAQKIAILIFRWSYCIAAIVIFYVTIRIIFEYFIRHKRPKNTKIKTDIKNKTEIESKNKNNQIAQTIEKQKKITKAILFKLPEPILRFPERIEIEEKYKRSFQFDFNEKKLSKSEKGHIYERYIGGLLEKVNYKVTYVGQKSSGGDGGIDLIAKDGECTWIIQCKNFKKENKVKPQDIKALHGAVDIYAKKHPNVIVRGAFFSHSGFSDKSQKDAEILNITLRSVELIHDPKQLRFQY